jgi:hypothetical protein
MGGFIDEEILETKTMSGNYQKGYIEENQRKNSIIIFFHKLICDTSQGYGSESA